MEQSGGLLLLLTEMHNRLHCVIWGNNLVECMSQRLIPLDRRLLYLDVEDLENPGVSGDDGGRGGAIVS